MTDNDNFTRRQRLSRAAAAVFAPRPRLVPGAVAFVVMLALAVVIAWHIDRQRPIDRADQAQLRDLVRTAATRRGEPHQRVYARLHAAFGVRSIVDLPRADLDAARQFLVRLD